MQQEFADLHAGVTILSQLPGQELVELGLEDAVSDELPLLGHLSRHGGLCKGRGQHFSPPSHRATHKQEHITCKHYSCDAVYTRFIVKTPVNYHSSSITVVVSVTREG